MDIHPKILRRAQENLDRNRTKILSQRDSAIGKLEGVLAFLRRGGASSDTVDLNDLVEEIEAINTALATRPDEIVLASAAISRRLRLIYALIKFMTAEQAADHEGKNAPRGVVAPGV